MLRRNFLTGSLLPLAALTATRGLAGATAETAVSSASALGEGAASGLRFPARQRLELGGAWQYEPLAWTVLQADGSIEANTANLPAAGKMAVPSNWHLNGLKDFHGRVAFRRRFAAAAEFAGQPAWLCFAGVDYFAEVRLNGQTLGRHEGYFEPFEMEVTGVLKRGENLLEVVVDAPRAADGTVWCNHKRQVKGILNQWLPVMRQMEPTGGIIGAVCLERRGAAQVRAVRYSTRVAPEVPEGVPLVYGTYPASYPKTPPHAVVTVEVEYWLREAGAAELELSAGEMAWKGTVAGEAGLNRKQLVLTVDSPRLWWTWDFGRPQFYDATVTLTRGDEKDTCALRMGLREIAFDPARGEWRLNGERFFVRGSNVIPDKWLAHLTEAQIAEDMKLLREANLNGVRMCVHVTRDEFYAACDSAGILVWQDFPLQWQYTMESGFVTEAGRQLRAMIRHLYNHPCIGLWTCQNEPDPPNRKDMDPTLGEIARRADSSRFVYDACDMSQHPYPGWYGGEIRDFEMVPGAPVVSEFGAQGLLSAPEMKELLGAHAWPPDAAWVENGFETHTTFTIARIARGKSLEEFIANSQAYQARLIQFSVEHYRRAKYTKLGGFFHFAFMDGWPTISWSVLSYRRVPKAGYAALKRAMQPVLPMVELGTAWLETTARSVELSAWLVNDTREELKDCRIVFGLRGAGRTIPLGEAKAEVGADSIAPVSAGPRLPDAVKKLTPGRYELVVTAKNAAGATLGENLYAMQVIDIGDFGAQA